jgi:TRAP transporter TAXI family solute receptor
MDASVKKTSSLANFAVSRRKLLQVGAGLTAAGLIGLPSMAWAARLRLTVVTGSTGGVFYPYGGGLAKVLTEKGKDIQATAQVTGGSVDNIKLLGEEADIGFSTIDSAYDATKGVGAYKDVGALDTKVLAVLYDSFMHVIVSASSGITSVAGLKGKRISVGSAGSSTEAIADRVLAVAGLNPMKDVIRDNLSVAESVGALKDGKIAGMFWIGGIPTSAVKDLAASGQPPLTFIPTGKELAVMEKKWPGLYRPMTLPANVYEGQAKAVTGLGVSNVLVVSGELADETVTRVLTTIFGNLVDVQKIHPEARKLTLAGAAAKTAVQFHPAAEKFYRAKGAMK